MKINATYGLLAGFAATAWLAGCAANSPPAGAPPAPPPMAAAAAPAPAGGPMAFDGIYRGEVGAGTAHQSKINCSIADHHARIDVKNGVATIHWNGILSGPVSPDGSVNIVAGSGASLVGSFSGGTFTGTLKGSYCAYPVPSLTKS